MNQRKLPKRRNWYAIDAHFRTSAGPIIEKKEQGREFRRRVRKELAKAEADMVYPEEILSPEEEQEIQEFLQDFSSFQHTTSGLEPPEE